MKTKKRESTETIKHLWHVDVRHRDYAATMNWFALKRVYFKTTSLWIVSTQKPVTQPNMDRALMRTRQFLKRNRRIYGSPTIEAVEHRGAVDN